MTPMLVNVPYVEHVLFMGVMDDHPDFSYKKLPFPAVAGCSCASRWSRPANGRKVRFGRSKNREMGKMGTGS